MHISIKKSLRVLAAEVADFVRKDFDKYHREGVCRSVEVFANEVCYFRRQHSERFFYGDMHK